MKKQTKIKKFFKRIEGFFVRIKQRYIVHHLLKTGGQEIIAQYRQHTNKTCEPINTESPIWVCWWQGEKAMPDIAKACFNSIKINP